MEGGKRRISFSEAQELWRKGEPIWCKEFGTVERWVYPRERSWISSMSLFGENTEYYAKPETPSKCKSCMHWLICSATGDCTEMEEMLSRKTREAESEDESAKIYDNIIKAVEEWRNDELKTIDAINGESHNESPGILSLYYVGAAMAYEKVAGLLRSSKEVPF